MFGCMFNNIRIIGNSTAKRWPRPAPSAARLLLPLGAFTPPQDADRRPREPDVIPEAPFHVPLVRVREELWIINEEHKGWWPGGRLRDVVDPTLAASLARRGLPERRLLDYRVEGGSGETLPVMHGSLGCRLQNLLNPLTRQRAGVNDAGPLEDPELGPEGLGVFVHGVRVLIDPVPLVDAQHERATLLDGGPLRQDKVLLARPLLGVDDEHHDVRSAHRLERPAHGEGFGCVLRCSHGRPPPDTRGVDQRVLLAVGADHVAVDGVPRGAAVVAHDRPRVARELVQERGLAHVGPTDDGNL
mmetsp:Transcript_4033/g.16462  ORF Transcript_4033/g.16462 Transcript_4033/m.16462 type:complete len:301 (-) Transcript_4033:1417-2319(-)